MNKNVKILSSGTVPYSQFKELSDEFFNATSDRTSVPEEKVENARRSLGILWLARTDDWTAEQVTESIELIRDSADREFEVQLAHAWKAMENSN